VEVKEMQDDAKPSTPIQKCLGEYIKVSGSNAPETHLGNVRIDPLFLDYVREQMGHEEVNGEVIGEAINMMAEFDDWETQLWEVK
jgi:hypothetical protein